MDSRAARPQNSSEFRERSGEILDMFEDIRRKDGVDGLVT
jgi:hypothetical protein